MKYYIQISVLGKHPIIELTQEEYVAIKAARAKLIASQSITEKFELLLQNFIELEKELLSISADLIISFKIDYTQSFEDKLKLNRRVVNLLTSTKLYIDQTMKHIRPFFNDKKIESEVKSFFREEYDGSFHYRFMEALRNYVQHDGLAIHVLSTPFRWLGEKPDNQLELRTDIFVSKEILKEDEGFKRRVLDEMDDKVDINISAREYIGCLSRVHVKLQSLIEDKTSESRVLLENYIGKYKTINNNQAAGLCVIARDSYDSNNGISDKFSLMLDWDDIRIKLNNKHKALGKIEKMFVSGSLVKTRAN